MKFNKSILIVLLAFLLEIVLLTFGRNLFGYHGSPVFLLLAGIALGMVPLLTRVTSISTSTAKPILGSDKHWAWFIFAIGVLVCVPMLAEIINAYKIDPRSSDVIPAIEEIYVQRTLNGEFVYQPFSEFGWTIFPNYLPLQWLPYLISGLLNFDHRWMAFGVLCLAILVIQLRLLRHSTNLPELLVKSLLPWLVLFFYLQFNRFSFGYSLETLIAGYYLLFGLSMISTSHWKRAGGLVLTLMSRFVSLLFVPLYLVVGILKEGWKAALIITGLVVLGILVIYVIPFMSQDPAIFFKGFDHYSIAAPGEWYPRGPDNRPTHLYQGTGMAFWFYTFAGGTVEEKIALLRIVQIGLSLGVTAWLGYFYYKRRDQLNHRLFLLLAFKIYLTIFYGFIQVPYVYLFLTPLMFSVLLVSELKWFEENREKRPLQS